MSTRNGKTYNTTSVNLKNVLSDYRAITFSTDDSMTISSPTVYFVKKDVELPVHLRKRSLRGIYGGSSDITTMMHEWLEKNSVMSMESSCFMVATNCEDSNMEL